MDVRQLEYFLELSKQEHMSSTAACLGISQPALSKSIANLEKELGTRLFDRHGNHISLNDSGRMFAHYAERSLNELQNGIHQLRQAQYDTFGVIRIVCHAFPDAITDCILAYTELNPKIRIDIGETESAGNLRVEEADFLLSAQDESALLSRDGKVWYPQILFKESRYVLISPRCRTYPEEITSVSMEELRDDYFVDMRDLSYFYTDITYKLAHAAGFFPKVFCSTEDFITKMHFVDAGRAICILPGCCLRMARRISPDVRIFEIANFDTERTLYLLRQKKTQMSEAALDFWDFVADYYAHPEEHPVSY